MNFFKKFNKLDFIDKTKNKKLLSLAVTIFGIGLVITGTSAAYLISEHEGSTNTLTAASLVLSLPSESEGITLSGVLPVTDEVGLEQDKTYTFTLKNTGDLKMDYAIYLKNKCTTETSIPMDDTSVTPDICIPSKYIKIAIKQDSGEYEISNLTNLGTLKKGTLDATETTSFEMKIWLDEETPNTYQGIQNGVVKNVIFFGQLELKAQQYSEEGIVDYEGGILTCDGMPEDTSNANAPSLASNMIPVCYNSEYDVWIKADSKNSNSNYRWYSYDGKMWANAVTVTETNRENYLNASVGEIIPMHDINTMWVWIPRFSATGDTANYNGGTQESPGAFNIKFVDKNTPAHDAFTFGSQNLSGMWMGKFENSSDTTCSASSNSAVGSGCNLNTIRPKIIPNVTSWRGAMVSTIFYDILNMTESGNQYGFDKTVDTHMMKNNEWGAVAYLTQSIYGRCTSSTSCTEVGINNNSSYITGYGAPAGSDSTVENGTYETALGQDASTTGNIYGVYDMSGGAYEYVMGVYWDGEKLWSGYSTSSNQHSGFNGWLYNEGTNYESGVEYPSDSKYYNLYTTESDYTSSGLQHAMTETSNWYRDDANFVYSSSPWFLRGGLCNSSTSAGVFNCGSNNGYSISHNSSRSSIIIN